MEHKLQVFSPPTRVDNVFFDMTYYELDEESPEHTHDCIEITVIFDGTATHVSGGGAHRWGGGTYA